MHKALGTLCVVAVLAGCGSSAPPAAQTPEAAPAGTDAPPAQPDGGAATSAPPAAPGAEPAPAPTAATGDKCEHLAKTCHDHAGGGALLKECHQIGHAGDAAKCGARHDECVAACQEAAKKGGHPPGAGGHKH